MAGETKSLNFLEEIITKDIDGGAVKSIVTRFPPISAYWARKVYMPEFWFGRAVWR